MLIGQSTLSTNRKCKHHQKFSVPRRHHRKHNTPIMTTLNRDLFYISLACLFSMGFTYGISLQLRWELIFHPVWPTLVAFLFLYVGGRGMSRLLCSIAAGMVVVAFIEYVCQYPGVIVSPLEEMSFPRVMPISHFLHPMSLMVVLGVLFSFDLDGFSNLLPDALRLMHPSP